MRSTTLARASFAIGLSALPNFTPLIAQLGSRCDFGVLCRTITPTKSSQPGAAFLTASKIANSSSGVATETRRSLRHHFFGGRAGACLISLGPLGFEDEEIALTAVAAFAGGFDKLFCMAQKMNALKFFAAIKIALPSLSSLVASCKISASIATQELRIKIQTNIVPSLRRLPPRPLQQISGKRRHYSAAKLRNWTLAAVPLTGIGSPRVCARSELSASAAQCRRVTGPRCSAAIITVYRRLAIPGFAVSTWAAPGCTPLRLSALRELCPSAAG
jgi:hypothetical protein